MIGYIWLWLLLLKGYRQNTRKQIPETESADQSLEILKCDFEQMILKRATELNTNERKFRNLVETLNKDYFFYQRDNQGKMTYVSPAVTSVLGYQPERFSSDFRYFLSNKRFDTLLDLSVQGIPFPPQQLELFDAENKKRWIEIAETPLYDEYGNCTGVHGLVFDITQRKLEEEKFIWLAFHDELTSLPNRRQFIDRLQQAIPLSNRNCMPFAVLYFCLDNLSNIVDEMGHGTADYLIREISKRLTGSIRESDLAARIGEDEFALLLPETDLPASATVAQNIIRNLYAPISFGLDSIQLDTHIGIAMYPRHGSDSEKLLQYADASMYYAKKKHLGYSSVIET
jgi:diguanylate cyclase (GGDEF)-like protein/PAS domain S-box-containing protein